MIAAPLSARSTRMSKIHSTFSSLPSYLRTYTLFPTAFIATMGLEAAWAVGLALSNF